MTQLAYGKSAFSRSRGNLPELPVINMFVEASKTETQGVVMQSRRGVVVDATVGSGPIADTYSQDGVFDGAEFVISDTRLYMDGVSLGTIDGDGPASWAGVDGELLVCRGASIWSYNGTNLAAVSFPDGSDVTAIGVAAGYFLALNAVNGYFYFAPTTDGRTWDGLDFAEIESEPDKALWLVVLDGNPVFFGTSSVEFWSVTGDADLPFAPIQQRSFEQGIYAPGCAVQIDNTFFWLGKDRIPYRNDNVPLAFGDDGIVERLQGSATVRVFLIEDQRHKFICFRGDDFTLAYDVTTGEWCEFQSYGRDNFRLGPGMGDDTNGTIWRFEGYLDNGSVLERRLRAGTQLEGPLRANRLRLACEIGTTEYLTGDYDEPQVEMRTSDDLGNTWSPYEAESLGEQGEYRTRVEWRNLGLFDEFGFLAEFRVTDPVGFRLSGIDLNGQSVGGRAQG